MTKITKSESLKVSEPLFKEAVNVLTKKEGREWSYLKDKTRLRSTIQSMACIEQHIFKDITDQECEKLLNPILDFQKDLIQLNKAAHQYNEKWYVKLLSIFFKDLKMKTLDHGIQEINSKIRLLKEMKLINEYVKKVNSRLEKYLEEGKHEKGFLRLTGGISETKDLVATFKIDSEMDFQVYSDAALASGLKMLLKDLSDPAHARILKTGLDKATTVEEALKAFNELGQIEKEFCKDLVGFLVNSYKYSWQLEGTSLEGLITSVGMISNREANPNALFPNLGFLIQNYEQIFGNSFRS